MHTQQYHIVHSNGDQEWRINGKDGALHRNKEGDLPAVIRANGDQEWHFQGKCHRDNDLPAVIRVNGDQFWYFYGVLHRTGSTGPTTTIPQCIPSNGEQPLHLPAVILANGDQAWYQHGKLHQNNGQPAVIRANGRKEWHYFGIRTAATVVDKIKQAQMDRKCRLLLAINEINENNNAQKYMPREMTHIIMQFTTKS